MKTVDLLERPDLMAKRIIKQFNASSPESIEAGYNWYDQAGFIANHIANKFNVPYSKVCGVIAALSPATNWVQNVADASNLVYAWSQGLDCDKIVVTTYGNNKKKAIRILGSNGSHAYKVSEIILGNSKTSKTHSFFMNIYSHSPEYVTIDRHAFRIAVNSMKADEICITEKRYRSMAEAYKIAAKKLKLEPKQLQAITWISFREHLPVTVPAAIHKLDPEIRAQIIG